MDPTTPNLLISSAYASEGSERSDPWPCASSHLVSRGSSGSSTRSHYGASMSASSLFSPWRANPSIPGSRCTRPGRWRQALTLVRHALGETGQRQGAPHLAGGGIERLQLRATTHGEIQTAFLQPREAAAVRSRTCLPELLPVRAEAIRTLPGP